jgi:hypothetical protein
MKGFTGAAGTGKTHRLMLEVDAWLSSQQLGDDQHVLALTRMHGSRRRLAERLSSSTARQRFLCMTLDRFAWLVASRWRALVESLGGVRNDDLDYDATAMAAAAVLRCRAARVWMRARYPLIIVDELQDCRGGQLEMVKALAEGGELFVAADEFQDLSADESNPAVEWLNYLEGVEELSEVRRTTKPGLLDGASALRAGKPLTKGSGLSIAVAKSAAMAAKIVACEIHFAHMNELVVISPTGPDRSRFVGDVLQRLGAKPFDYEGKHIGPYRVAWQGPLDSRLKSLLSELMLPTDVSSPVNLAELPSVDSEDGRAIGEWANRRMRLGEPTSSAGEIRKACQRCIQQSRSWARSPRGLWGTTAHGAKNREFEQVVILWPYESQSEEKGARLLYNAITRAKQRALIVVQDPKDERLKEPPFSGWSKPSADRGSRPEQLVLPGLLK